MAKNGNGNNRHLPVNTQKSGNRGGKRATSWKPGQSGNPKGCPRRGQSWAEIIKSVGDMTPTEAASFCKSIAGELRKLGDEITLKEVVVLRVFTSLVFEPQPGLLNAFMDRAEGKIAQSLIVDWRREAEAAGIDVTNEYEQLVSKFAASMVGGNGSGSVDGSEAQDGRGDKAPSGNSEIGNQ